jgi:selenide,water dikinase
LDQVLRGVPRVSNENVLVGYDTADDAGVYRLSEDLALVQTVDFFTPIVDDPATYGAIAAANALSDVYAMGGRPVSALSIVAFPGKQDPNVLQRILTGGAEKMREACCVVLGGHSINDEEIKFGYAVTGTIHPKQIWTNAGARPGDVLVFTKRIGTGVIGTALKRGLAEERHAAGSVASMLALNAAAAGALAGREVHACTDVTGFGLLGHAREMAVGSNVTLEIDSASVPLLPGALEYARQGCLPGGLKNNREFAADCVRAASAIPAELLDLLYDPQTSGGLLVSLPEEHAIAFANEFPTAVRIGRVLPQGEKPILVL